MCTFGLETISFSSEPTGSVSNLEKPEKILEPLMEIYSSNTPCEEGTRRFLLCDQPSGLLDHPKIENRINKSGLAEIKRKRCDILSNDKGSKMNEILERKEGLANLEIVAKAYEREDKRFPRKNKRFPRKF